jgi:hypothetical protein
VKTVARVEGCKLDVFDKKNWIDEVSDFMIWTATSSESV